MINKFTKSQLIGMVVKNQIEKIVMKIDKATAGKFNSKEKRLGFDWSFVRHSADPVDFMKQFKNEIKWGFQRFCCGYDDQVFWGLDTYLDELIMISLEWYINNRHGSPVIERAEPGKWVDGKWVEGDCHEKWTKELKKMLHHFEQSDDRWCNEKNEYDSTVDLDSKFLPSDTPGFSIMEHTDLSEAAEELREKWFQRGREIDAYKAEQHKKALEMLIKYYRSLWD